MISVDNLKEYPVLLLAGGAPNPEFRGRPNGRDLRSWEILVPGEPEQQRRLLHVSLDAWRGAGFEEIYVYGEDQALNNALAYRDYGSLARVLAQGENMLRMSDSIIHALDMLESYMRDRSSDRVIIAATDMPYITLTAVNDLLHAIVKHVGNKEPQIIWPICRVKSYRSSPFGDLSAFSCTALPLADDVFTGCNVFIVERRHVLQHIRGLLETATASRKGTMQLAGMLGFPTLLRLALSSPIRKIGYPGIKGLRFQLSELEELVAQKLRVVIKGVPCDLPGLSIDIDNGERLYTYSYDWLRNQTKP